MTAVLGHVADLWTGGGAVMPALFCAAFALWSTLGSRALSLRRGLRGDIASALARAIADPSALPRRGVLGEAVVRGALAWRQARGPVPARTAALALADLYDSLGAGTSLSRALVAVAPLLGLLGTVTGLIETFGALGMSARSTASEGIAAGIVEALYATQMGLAIAVPGLLAGGILHQREVHLRTELDHLEALLGGAHVAEGA